MTALAPITAAQKVHTFTIDTDSGDDPKLITSDASYVLELAAHIPGAVGFTCDREATEALAEAALRAWDPIIEYGRDGEFCVDRPSTCSLPDRAADELLDIINSSDALIDWAREVAEVV